MVMPRDGFASWLSRQPTPAYNIRPTNAPTNRRDLQGIRGMMQQPSLSQPQLTLPAPSVLPQTPTGAIGQGTNLSWYRPFRRGTPQPMPPTPMPVEEPPPPPPPDPDAYSKLNNQLVSEGKFQYLPKKIVTGGWDDTRQEVQTIDNPLGTDLGPLDRNHYDTFKTYDTGQKSGFGVGDQKSLAMEQMFGDPALADEIAKESQARRIEQGLAPTVYFEDGVKFMAFMNLMNNKRNHQKVKQTVASQKALRTMGEALTATPLPEEIKIDLSRAGGPTLEVGGEGTGIDDAIYGWTQRNLTALDIGLAITTAAVGYTTGGAGISGVAPAWAWRQGLRTAAKWGSKELLTGMAVNSYFHDGLAEAIESKYELGAVGGAVTMAATKGRSAYTRGLLGAGVASAGYALGSLADAKGQDWTGDVAGSLLAGIGTWKYSGNAGTLAHNMAHTGSIPKGFRSTFQSKNAPLMSSEIAKAKEGYRSIADSADKLELQLKNMSPEQAKEARKTIKDYRKIAKEYKNIDSGFTYGQLSDLEKKATDEMREALSARLLEFADVSEVRSSTAWAFNTLAQIYRSDPEKMAKLATREADATKPSIWDISGIPKEPRGNREKWMDLYDLPKTDRESLEALHPRDVNGNLVPPRLSDAATNINDSVANARHVKESMGRANSVAGRTKISDNGRIVDPDFEDVHSAAFDRLKNRKTPVTEQIFRPESPVDEVIADQAARTIKIRNHIDIARVAFQMFGANMKTAKAVARIVHDIDDWLGGTVNLSSDDYLQSRIKGAIEAVSRPGTRTLDDWEIDSMVVEEIKRDWPGLIKEVDPARGITLEVAQASARKALASRRGQKIKQRIINEGKAKRDYEERAIEVSEVIDGKATGKVLKLTDYSDKSTGVMAWVDRMDDAARIIYVLKEADPKTLVHELGHAWEKTIKVAARGDRRYRNGDQYNKLRALEEDMYNSILAGTNESRLQATVEEMGNWKPGAPWNNAIKEEFAERIGASLSNIFRAFGDIDISSVKTPEDLLREIENVSELDSLVDFASRAILDTHDLKTISDRINLHKNVRVRQLFTAAILKSRNIAKTKDFYELEESLDDAVEGTNMAPLFGEGMPDSVQARRVFKLPEENPKIKNYTGKGTGDINYEEIDYVIDLSDLKNKVNNRAIEDYGEVSRGSGVIKAAEYIRIRKKSLRQILRHRFVEYLEYREQHWKKKPTAADWKRAEREIEKIIDDLDLKEPDDYLAGDYPSAGYHATDITFDWSKKDGSVKGHIDISVTEDGIIDVPLIEITGGWLFPAEINQSDLIIKNQLKSFYRYHAWDNKKGTFVRSTDNAVLANDQWLADITAQLQLMFPHMRYMFGSRASGAKAAGATAGTKVAQRYDFRDLTNLDDKKIFGRTDEAKKLLHIKANANFDRLQESFADYVDDYVGTPRKKLPKDYSNFPDTVQLIEVLEGSTLIRWNKNKGPIEALTNNEQRALERKVLEPRSAEDRALDREMIRASADQVGRDVNRLADENTRLRDLMDALEDSISDTPPTGQQLSAAGLSPADVDPVVLRSQIDQGREFADQFHRFINVWSAGYRFDNMLFNSLGSARDRFRVRSMIDEIKRAEAALSPDMKGQMSNHMDIIKSIDNELLKLDRERINDIPTHTPRVGIYRGQETVDFDLMEGKNFPYAEWQRSIVSGEDPRRLDFPITEKLQAQMGNLDDPDGGWQARIRGNDESVGSIVNDTPGENAAKVVVVEPADEKNILEIPPIGWGLPRSLREKKAAYRFLVGFVPKKLGTKKLKISQELEESEDVYDSELFASIINPLVDMIQQGMERSNSVASSVTSVIDAKISDAFKIKGFRGMERDDILMTKDGRIPFLAGVDIPSAPTVQDVAARWPIYRDSGLLSDDMIEAFETLRKLLQPYDTLLRNGKHINLERDRFRPDILLSDDPSNSGFYVPRGSAQQSADDFNAFDAGKGTKFETTRFGATTKIGALNKATFDSMAEALDAGYEYVPLIQAISSYIKGARRLGYQDYFTRVILKMKEVDGDTPLWYSPKRLIALPQEKNKYSHPELSKYVFGEDAKRDIENIEIHLYENNDTARAKKLTLYTKDDDYTKMGDLADELEEIAQNGKLTEELKGTAGRIAASLNKKIGQIDELKNNPRYRNDLNKKAITVYNNALNDVHRAAGEMSLAEFTGMTGINLRGKYLPHYLRAIMEHAFPRPPEPSLPLRGPGGVLEKARFAKVDVSKGAGGQAVSDASVIAKYYAGQSKQYLKIWTMNNRLYSTIGATWDNSSIGINLMFRLLVDIKNSGFGTKGSYDAAKVISGKMTPAELQRMYPSLAALKANVMILNPLQYPDHARLVNGRLMAHFNELAIARGMPTAEDWAQVGLRMRGTQHEYSLSFFDKLPVFRRAGMLFGYTGDQARLAIADSELEHHLRTTGKTLQQAKADGSMESIAKHANRSMGFSPQSGTYDIGELLLFAPNFFRARFEMIYGALRASVPIGRRSLDQKLARRDMAKFLGSALVLTVAINEALGNDTDLNPVIVKKSYRGFPRKPDVQWNPNFLRIRYGDRDYSLLGAYDSMFRMILTAGQGDVTTFNSVLGGSPRAVIDLITQSNFFGKPLEDLSDNLEDTGYDWLADTLAYIWEGYKPWAATEMTKMAVGDFREEVTNKNWHAAAIDASQIGGEAFGPKSAEISFGDIKQDVTESEYQDGRVSAKFYSSLEPHERTYITDLVNKQNPDLYKDLPQKLDQPSIYMAKSRELNEIFKETERDIFDAFETATGPIALREGRKLTAKEARSKWWNAYMDIQQAKIGVKFALDRVQFDQDIEGKGTEEEKKALRKFYDIGDREDISLKGEVGIEFNSDLYMFYVTSLLESELTPDLREYVVRNIKMKSNYPDEWNKLFRESNRTREILDPFTKNRNATIYTSYGLQMEMQKAREKFQSKHSPKPSKFLEGGILEPQLENIGAGIKGLAESLK